MNREKQEESAQAPVCGGKNQASGSVINYGAKWQITGTGIVIGKIVPPAAGVMGMTRKMNSGTMDWTNTGKRTTMVMQIRTLLTSTRINTMAAALPTRIRIRTAETRTEILMMRRTGILTLMGTMGKNSGQGGSRFLPGGRGDHSRMTVKEKKGRTAIR